MSCVALVADAHGDVDALRGAIAAARRRGAEEIWCLGDLVGDEHPNETIALATRECNVVIAGNHDLITAQRINESYVATHRNVLAIRERLTAENMEILAALPERHAGHSMIATHACLDHPTARIEDAYDADVQLALCDVSILAVGHSHAAFACVDSCQWISAPLDAGTVALGAGGVVCPGSVVAVDGTPASFCIVDTRGATCRWHLTSG